MAEQVRTFIAIELGEGEHRALGKLQEQLKGERAAKYVRWVAPDNIHLTLKFLGGVEGGMIPAVERALVDACSGITPFHLTLGGLGAFPNTRRPNVIWVGIGGDVEKTTRLAEQIDGACQSLGFAREARPFSPHLTLGRVKRDSRPADQQYVGEMIAKTKVGQLSEFDVTTVTLMKSDLRPTGSVYTQLFVVDLK